MNPDDADDVIAFWAVPVADPVVPPTLPEPMPPAGDGAAETFLLRGYEPPAEGTHPRLFGRGEWAA